MQSTLTVSLLALLAFVLPVSAQQTTTVTGTVLDAETGQPIPAASIVVPSAGKRTFSQSNGAFRLPLPPGEHRARITSIGYMAAEQTISASGGPVTIRLKASPVSLRDVTVSGEITPEEIIRRTIARKEENQSRLKTFQGLLYSKFALEIAGNAFGRIEDQDRNLIAETFSRNYYDAERGPRIEIIQRRQTANLPAADNLIAIGNFVSFYEESIPILNANILSPLSSDPFSRYDFRLLERTTLDSNVVYVIGVTPSTRLLPAFEGTIKIVRGTYDLVEVDLAPSASTSISFVRNLRFQQKFERFQGGALSGSGSAANDVWWPTYLRITGDAEVEIVKGFAEIKPKIVATSIYTEVKVNDPLPDSIFAEKRIITAAANADSVRSEFWEKNSLSELSEEEKAIYQKVDSLVTAADTTGELSGFTIGLYPVANFNRVGSLMLGAGVAPRFPGPVRLDVHGFYSFGLKRSFGEARARVSLVDEPFRLSVGGGLFSTVQTMTTDRSYPPVINSFTSLLFHRDYYDYFRSDGWSAGLNADFGEPYLSAEVGTSRQFSLSRTTPHSLFEKNVFRPNPGIVEGSFRTASAEIGWGNPNAFLVISSNPSIGIDASVKGTYGETTDRALVFRGAEGVLDLTVPTIPTGYAPMLLRVIFSGGIASDMTPPQYQYRLQTSNAFVGRFNSFRSAPVGIIGGTRYGSVYADHNFGDVLWRAVGLPTYEGRGIELSLAGGAAQFYQDAPAGYLPTGRNWYSEVGFGLGKIPTFISNVFFLSFDARWGVGPLGSGKFGATVGLSSPF